MPPMAVGKTQARKRDPGVRQYGADVVTVEHRYRRANPPELIRALLFTYRAPVLRKSNTGMENLD